MLNKAEQNQEDFDEAKKIYAEVKEQLIATGRQDPQTAKHSALLIPAYVTVYAQKAGISIKEAYADMGLKDYRS